LGASLDWVNVRYGGFAVDDGRLRTECSEKELGLLVYRQEKFGDCQIRDVTRVGNTRAGNALKLRIDWLSKRYASIPKSRSPLVMFASSSGATSIASRQTNRSLKLA
jgi:hypothetical protein